MKRPSFQFYPADWRKDAALQSCSMSAQGLWINLLCIAHECEPYGYLVVNGRAMKAEQIARLVGLSLKDCTKLMQEIIETGVIEITSDGVMFSRRMVKDEAVRSARAEGGKAGSEHGYKGAEHGSKGGRPSKGMGGKKPPLEPPPSSSSSSSSSTSVNQDQKQLPPASPAAALETPPKKSAKFDPLTAKPLNVSDGAWADWCAHRKKSGMTAIACERIAKKLEGHHDPDYVLYHSIENGWTGLFPEKITHENGSTNRGTVRLSAVDQVKQAIAERENREALATTDRQALAEDDRDVRAPLDGEFRRVG